VARVWLCTGYWVGIGGVNDMGAEKLMRDGEAME